MSVAADDPEDFDKDERLTDDDTEVEAVPVEYKKGPGRPHLNALESAKLSEQMWEEYAGGMSMRQIADLHMITRPAVWKRLRKFRAQLGIEDVTEAKALDLGRYEALIERVWAKAFQEPTVDNIKLVAVLMDQRAKLLGLNAPKRLSVDGQMNVAPSPALVKLLDRVQHERDKLGATIERPELPSPEVIEAELIDDE
jgi:predicted transcriptional regulator